MKTKISTSLVWMVCIVFITLTAAWFIGRNHALLQNRVSVDAARAAQTSEPTITPEITGTEGEQGAAAAAPTDRVEPFDPGVFVFKGEDNQEMKHILVDSFDEITGQFGIEFEGPIEVNIFPSQAEFWQSTFPDSENNGMTTGFADPQNRVIYLTSINDTSIKPREDMLKVPRHELVHILLPHPWLDFREGIAVYLADQLQAYTVDEIPFYLGAIITYQGDAEDIKRSYSFAGWKVKFIFEECLQKDAARYLELVSTPNKELDFSLLGFENESFFIVAFKDYLVANAAPQ